MTCTLILPLRAKSNTYIEELKEFNVVKGLLQPRGKKTGNETRILQEGRWEMSSGTQKDLEIQSINFKNPSCSFIGM